MQMLKASELIKDPNILRKLLASKYYFSSEDYLINITDIFLFKKGSKMYAMYNEVILMSDPSDYFKRVYAMNETIERIPKLTEYYRTYQMFFCRPILTNWLNCFLLKKHFDKKAEVFYMNNYYSKNDGIVSFERNAYLDEESSMTNNITNTRTIFDTRIKDQINNIKDIDINDKNPIDNNVLISTISFENNNLNTLNSSYDLYSKKSPAESLGNLVTAFKQGPPLIKKKMIQFNRKAIQPLSKSKEKENDKSSTQPYKPYLHNYRSNLIEFTQNKVPLFISKKSQSKMNILVKSSRNNQNISSFINKPNDNKTYDSKYTQISKLCKPMIKQNQTLFNKDKKQMTRNNNISLSSMANIFNISQKSLNVNNANTKTTNHKHSLSTCNSVVNIKKKKSIAIQKPHLLIQATTNIKNTSPFSRNKKKEQYGQSIIMKNMTSLLYNNNRKPKSKASVITTTNYLRHNNLSQKMTKSVDEREREPSSKSSFSMGVNYKYSVREISKTKKTKYPMTLKMTNQLNDLLKYSKRSNPSIVKYTKK